MSLIRLPEKWMARYNKACYVMGRIGYINLLFLGLWTAMYTAQYLWGKIAPTISSSASRTMKGLGCGRW